MTSKLTISESWHEFTQETSMHGIRYVKMKNISIFRRVLWGLMIVGMLTYLSYAGYLFMDGFLKKSIKTRTTVRNAADLVFPTITICNRNYWKKSVAEPPGTPEAIRDVFRELMRDLYIPGMPTPPPDKYNWSAPYLAPWLTSELDPEATLKQMAHTVNETFAYCVVNGISKPCREILTQVTTDAGICYQFNGDGTFVSNKAGLSGGVQFYMDALTYEYYIGPFSMSEGFSVAIHDKDEIPLVSELHVSYGLKTGTHTSMIMQKKETKRVPPPADDNKSDCFDTEKLSNPLHYYKTYSHAACQFECSISHVLRECGCLDFLHPKLNSSRTCNVKEMLYCAIPAKREYLADSAYLEKCACKSSCDETQYSAKLSAYTFPSEQYMNVSGMGMAVPMEYMKKNFIAVDIYYGQMSYELLDEEIAYKITDMIASLGGTFGVCIGASLLTLAEFIEFLIMTISRLVMRCTSNSVNDKTRVQPIAGSSNGDVRINNWT